MSDDKTVTEAALNRYAFFKSAYFQELEHHVNDGKMPEDEYELELDEDFAGSRYFCESFFGHPCPTSG